MKWLALRFLWLIGYLWMAPLALVGFMTLWGFELRGRVIWSRFEGPAYLVRVGGPFAEWLARRDWYGWTMGPCCFFWVDPDPNQIVHEKRHVAQEMVLGLFVVVVYLVSYLWGLIRYRSFFEAYRRCWNERDARRAADEEV